MRLPPIGIHILTSKGLNRRIESAKTEQRKMTSAIMARLLRDNAVLKNKLTKISKKSRR